MKNVPVVFKWQTVDVADETTGVVQSVLAMVPNFRYRIVAGRQFHVGEEYPLVVMESRSRAAHNRYFAALNEAFHNLPETMAERWPTVEHFRAWLLIETHWCYEKEIDCADEKNARRLAMHSRSESPHARIILATDPKTSKKTKVFIKVPMSQDHSAMDKEAFKQSSDAVLDLAAHFVSVSKGSLVQNAGRSA